MLPLCDTNSRNHRIWEARYPPRRVPQIAYLSRAVLETGYAPAAPLRG